MKRAIGPSEILVGDTVEREHLGVTTKLTVHRISERPGVGFYSIDLARIVHRPGAQWFLLDRPQPILYPAGTHLWLTREHYPWANGEEIVLSVDWIRGFSGRVNWPAKHGLITMSVDDDAVTSDRPIPPVALPEVPTLGWATHSRDGQHFGFFNRDTAAGTVDCHTPDWGTFSWSHEFVTAFTEAVAVPKEALDELRRRCKFADGLDYPADRRTLYGKAAQTFLAAIPTPGDAS